MPKVSIRENEDFDELVRRFKRSVNKSGVIADFRKHDYYIKPGLRRRLKDEQSRRKRKF